MAERLGKILGENGAFESRALSQKKLQVALAKAAAAKSVAAAKSKTTSRRSKKGGMMRKANNLDSKTNKLESEDSAVEVGVSKNPEVDKEKRATVKAVARLILSGKCRRIAFLTGPGCSVGT